MKPQAKFFCENCNEEVKLNARFCNKCGRFFSSVRCPVCGKVGSSNMFVNGCPACGYADKNKNAKTKFQKTKSDYINTKKNHFYAHKSHSKKTQNSKESSSLPLWIYLITFSTLVFMILFLMKCSY